MGELEDKEKVCVSLQYHVQTLDKLQQPTEEAGAAEKLIVVEAELVHARQHAVELEQQALRDRQGLEREKRVLEEQLNKFAGGPKKEDLEMSEAGRMKALTDLHAEQAVRAELERRLAEQDNHIAGSAESHAEVQRELHKFTQRMTELERAKIEAEERAVRAENEAHLAKVADQQRAVKESELTSEVAALKGKEVEFLRQLQGADALKAEVEQLSGKLKIVEQCAADATQTEATLQEQVKILQAEQSVQQERLMAEAASRTVSRPLNAALSTSTVSVLSPNPSNLASPMDVNELPLSPAFSQTSLSSPQPCAGNVKSKIPMPKPDSQSASPQIASTLGAEPMQVITPPGQQKAFTTTTSNRHGVRPGSSGISGTRMPTSARTFQSRPVPATGVSTKLAVHSTVTSAKSPDAGQLISPRSRSISAGTVSSVQAALPTRATGVSHHLHLGPPVGQAGPMYNTPNSTPGAVCSPSTTSTARAPVSLRAGATTTSTASYGSRSGGGYRITNPNRRT